MKNGEQCVREGRPSPLRFGAFLQLLYLICFGARLSGRPSTSTIVGEIEKGWSHVVIGDLLMFCLCDQRGAARFSDGGR
jgi:hypothetical protein